MAALTHGIDLGMTLIDTAEMYGDGGAEKVVARRSPRRRDDGVCGEQGVSAQRRDAKRPFLPASAACAACGIDCLDLYLLHWRGAVPLAETVDAFERLRADGKIARWGVSNFDTRTTCAELLALPAGRHCAANQVLYHLAERGIEWELLVWMRERALPRHGVFAARQGALVREPQAGGDRTQASAPRLRNLRWRGCCARQA